MNIDQIKKAIVDVPGFPKPEIIFKDITPLLEDSVAFESVIHHMCESITKKPGKIVAIESRGFILGAAMALKMNCGLVLARKQGKLPGPTQVQEFSLEYGTAALEIKTSSLNSTDQVVIVDDVLATGGTAQAAQKLCENLGAKVLSFSFLIELGFLKGKAKLSAPTQSLVKY